MNEHINAYAGDWSQSDADILALIEADVVPNPEPQTQVRKTIYSLELLMLLGDESKVKVADYPNLGLVKAAINEQNHNAMIEWVYVLYSAQRITYSEMNACIAHIQGTIPDPAYRAQIPALEIEIGRAVELADVWMARKEWEKEQAQEANNGE